MQCITFAWKHRFFDMQTMVKVSTSIQLLNDESNEITKSAIEEARMQQEAYRSGKIQIEPQDFSSVENMLKSLGV